MKRYKFFTETGTWTATSSLVWLTICGGGGGAGGGDGAEPGNPNGGNGGGAAEYTIDYIFVTVPGTAYSVIVGSEGVGGLGGVYQGSGTAGTAGGNTSFGTLTVTGGKAGQAGGGVPGGTITVSISGTSTNYVVGQIRSYVGTGGHSNDTTTGGRGGTTPFVNTFTIVGTKTVGNGTNGGNGTGWGCGGAGGGGGNGLGTEAGDGGDGSAGFVLIKY